MPRQVIILKRTAVEGVWVDDDGNKWNDDWKMIDDWGNVISEPEEEPATSPYGNGSAGTFQTQTLADYNRPDLFYHKRAEIQAEIDSLNEEPPEQDFQFQNCGVQSKGWNDAPMQVQEAPVEQDSEILARIQRVRKECANYFKNLDAIFFPARNTAEMNQKEVIESKVEEKVGFDKICQLSIDSDETVSGENTGVDRQDMTIVDRQQPSHPVSDVLKSLDASEPPPEPPKRVPELPNPDPDPEPREPDPKLPDHHETELVGVLPEEAATPGSCHKRKIPDTTLQPSLKRIRANSGAAIIPIAAYLPDPGDTFAVYSRGPRPPPFEQWYVLFELLPSSAGTCSFEPKSHPDDVAYLPDPEETDAVYHLGPRPP